MEDTGCTATICGSLWLESYKSELRDRGIHHRIRWSSDRATFTFGGDGKASTPGKARFPCFPFGDLVYPESFVVKGSTPLLLSNPQMESWGLDLLLSKGQQRRFGRPVPFVKLGN